QAADLCLVLDLATQARGPPRQQLEAQEVRLHRDCVLVRCDGRDTNVDGSVEPLDGVLHLGGCAGAGFPLPLGDLVDDLDALAGHSPGDYGGAGTVGEEGGVKYEEVRIAPRPVDALD